MVQILVVFHPDILSRGFDSAVFKYSGYIRLFEQYWIWLFEDVKKGIDQYFTIVIYTYLNAPKMAGNIWKF